MGFFKDIGKGFINLISDDPNQYITTEVRLDKELAVSMNNSGVAKISAADAALLEKTSKAADVFANDIDERQKSSIVLYASDMVIRARNGIEKWFKTRKANKKLASNLNKSISNTKTELPKDETVKTADSTNGVIKNIPANELENIQRTVGGKEREPKIK